MNDIPLGFGPSPRPEYIYVGGDGPTGWYSLDLSVEPARQVPIEHMALYGYITGVGQKVQAYKGDEKEKLDIFVSAGYRRYVIRSGLYTNFAKSILAAMERLKPEHFSRLLCIEIQRGNEEKVIFGNLYNAENGKAVRYDRPNSDAEVDEIYRKVAAKFSEVGNGGRRLQAVAG